MAKILVTGGAGFIGSHLVDRLLAENHDVRSFDRVRPEHSHQRLESHVGSFEDSSAVCTALSGMDVCYHLISTTVPASSNADPDFDITSNLLGTLRFLQHAVNAGVSKVIFISSGGTVYGEPRKTPIPETHPTEPICSYGIVKLAIEKYLEIFRRMHGLEYVILRVSNPYGERQRMASNQGAVAVFLGKAWRGETIEIWGDGSVIRDYVHIEDVTAALTAALDYDGTHRLFNIGAGCGLDLNRLLDLIERALGAKTTRRYLPSRAFDVPENVLDIRLAAAELGWKPSISHEKGLERMSEWLKRTSRES